MSTDDIIREQLKQGTQIAYVPQHANKVLTHPDVRFGFVTSIANDGDVFCRYWSPGCKELRTKANSEKTPIDSIYIINSVAQEQVDEAIKQYCQ